MAKPKRRNPDPFIDWNNTYRADQLVWAALCSKRTNGVANLSPHNGECIAYGCKTAPIALDKA